MEGLNQSQTQGEDEEPVVRAVYSLLGRAAGTATGWDLQDTCVIILYDFEPVKGCHIPKGDVTIDFNQGYWFIWEEDKAARSGDLIEALKDAAKYEE